MGAWPAGHPVQGKPHKELQDNQFHKDTTARNTGGTQKGDIPEPPERSDCLRTEGDDGHAPPDRIPGRKAEGGAVLQGHQQGSPGGIPDLPENGGYGDQEPPCRPEQAPLHPGEHRQGMRLRKPGTAVPEQGHPAGPPAGIQGILRQRAAKAERRDREAGWADRQGDGHTPDAGHTDLRHPDAPDGLPVWIRRGDDHTDTADEDQDIREAGEPRPGGPDPQGDSLYGGTARPDKVHLCGR